MAAVAVAQDAAYTQGYQPKPRAVKLYRESNSNAVNIMHDKRVYRGSTLQSTGTNNPTSDPVDQHQRHDQQRKQMARRRADAQRRPHTPDAVEGRQHMEIQTELYLEALSDRIPEVEAATQTDAFLDRAPSPFYVPQKSGLDASTQILAGELFDFELECTPLVSMLVGKTLEQATMELVEEDEMAMLRLHQAAFEMRRNAEQAETQRLEEAERRRQEEKTRRLVEHRRQHVQAQDAAEKVAARAFAKQYLSSLVPGVLDHLQTTGYFVAPVEKEVKEVFGAWLQESVSARIKTRQRAQGAVHALLRHVISQRRQLLLQRPTTQD